MKPYVHAARRAKSAKMLDFASRKTSDSQKSAAGSSDEHLVMLPKARLIRLIGDHTPTVTAPAAELLPALYECGTRFLRLLDQLGGPAQVLARYLRPFAEGAGGGAEAALTRHRSDGYPRRRPHTPTRPGKARRGPWRIQCPQV